MYKAAPDQVKYRARPLLLSRIFPGGNLHHTQGDTIEDEKPEPDEKSEIKIFRDDGCKICNPVEVITVPCYDRIDAN